MQQAASSIRDKLPFEALVRFYRPLAAVEPDIVSPVAPEEEIQFGSTVAGKDAHVVAAAVRGGAAYLVTLDRKLLASAEVGEAGLPVQILLPGKFISLVLH